MRTIILALLLSLALAQTYEAWTADFQAVAPQWGTGYFDGTIKYDWPAGFMQIVFNNAGGYTEFYQFNTGKGYDTKVSTGQFTYQYLYKSSTSCPCETLALQFAMPPLFTGSVATGAGGQITSLDFWTTQTNPVQEKTYRGDVNKATQWFANKDLYVNILDANGQPSGSQKGYFMSKFFIMSNDASGLPTIPAAFGISDEQQRTFNLLNVKNVATGSLGLKPPTTGCKCGKLLDIVVSLDRSGSISNAQWALEYAFVKNLTGSFEYDSTKANFGLVNWNSQHWDTISITSGTSLANVNTAINAMKCCSTDTRSTSSCCCCGTPIGGGIWGGYNMISKSSRSKATKVLVVLTDGCQNHLWYPPNKAVSCGCSSEKACAANTTCTGDITKYYKLATNNIPNLKVLAVGVGDASSICQDQLLLAAGGDPTNVFNPQSWDQLGSIVQTISATACTADNVVCPGCCGICTCGVCQPATKCDSPDLCNIGTVDPVTGCCTTTPVTCTADPCNRAFCSPSLGCQQEKISCKLPVDCIEYYCDPALNMTSCATRAVKDDPDCSTVVVPECVTSEDCSNNNLCLPETCEAGKCVKGEATKCNPDTKCTQYQCKPSVGCVVTSTLKCNDNNNCTIDSCDDLTGCVYQNVTCKKPVDPCQDVICDTTLGCLTVPVTCSNLTAGNCTVPACNRTCYLDYICFTPPPTGDSEESFPVAVVTAASIGTAAAVGIALGAAVLVAGAGGGAAVAIAGAAGAGGVVMVQSNPVYQGAGTAGSNPLHKGS